MNGPKAVQRQWTENLVADEVRLRCSYKRHGKQILQFTVQSEVFCHERWQAVVRYDNAHGFCHRDTIHADGTQDKMAVFVGDLNTAFTYAIGDLKANWPAYYARFLKETNP